MLYPDLESSRRAGLAIDIKYGPTWLKTSFVDDFNFSVCFFFFGNFPGVVPPLIPWGDVGAVSPIQFRPSKNESCSNGAVP